MNEDSVYIKIGNFELVADDFNIFSVTSVRVRGEDIYDAETINIVFDAVKSETTLHIKRLEHEDITYGYKLEEK